MLSGNHLSGVSEPKLQMSKGPGVAQSFDAKRLTEVWKSFAESVDAAQLKSALSVREPLLLEDFCIEYNLDNEVQRQRIILDVKPKLLAYLYKELSNDRITVEFKVSENMEEIVNKPYTDQEKFNVLVAKYPLLGTLKQKFGLDFE
jgi:DNA polymerase-3 subunit gamma/tau